MAQTHSERRWALLEKLARETARMRAAQRKYFKSRKDVDLIASKDHESNVDAILAEIETATRYAKAENPAQAGLFED